MAGEGQPRLLEWEVKPPPLANIGTLRFYGGVVPGRVGPEEVEQVAILDLDADTVIAIEPHRQGKKVANWTWQDDRVVVASVDGATDEFVLRTGRPRDVARRDTEQGGSAGRRGDSSIRINTIAARAVDRAAKSIFQLLFGN